MSKQAGCEPFMVGLNLAAEERQQAKTDRRIVIQEPQELFLGQTIENARRDRLDIHLAKRVGDHLVQADYLVSLDKPEIGDAVDSVRDGHTRLAGTVNENAVRKIAGSEDGIILVEAAYQSDPFEEIVRTRTEIYEQFVRKKRTAMKMTVILSCSGFHQRSGTIPPDAFILPRIAARL